MSTLETDIAVIGAGNVGIAVAYYLKKYSPATRVLLIDRGQPMAFTSAQSGENYRNWWPHSVMRAFTGYSIDLMEKIARESDNFIQMTRRGYLLATRRADISKIQAGLGEEDVRHHTNGSRYEPAVFEDWQKAPEGVDILSGDLVGRYFPYLDKAVENVIHIRRAGMISGQQLGQYMLSRYRAAGGERFTGDAEAIVKAHCFEISMKGSKQTIKAERIVNAAGPMVADVAKMVGVELPVQNWLQQKIAFEDEKAAIERTMPFAIDLDAPQLDWDDETRSLLRADPEFNWLTEELPSGVHCRPEGGDKGTWVKLGWAYNQESSTASFEPQFEDQFPEVVLRGASRLHPGLQAYDGKPPSKMVHYGGYYTLTKENWPLLGPTQLDGFYVAGALSGFGTMAACASGDLLARWVTDQERPWYADALSPLRYQDPSLMEEMNMPKDRGIL